MAEADITEANAWQNANARYCELLNLTLNLYIALNQNSSELTHLLQQQKRVLAQIEHEPLSTLPPPTTQEDGASRREIVKSLSQITRINQELMAQINHKQQKLLSKLQQQRLVKRAISEYRSKL